MVPTAFTVQPIEDQHYTAVTSQRRAANVTGSFKSVWNVACMAIRREDRPKDRNGKARILENQVATIVIKDTIYRIPIAWSFACNFPAVAVIATRIC